MDSTLNSSTHQSFSKLPVKRKIPNPDDDQPSIIHASSPATASASSSPPFKFHRIWTEPDEIRFLQGLLDSSSLHLAFPRDLGLFYTRFSDSMSQPYTKSQLSEKLRRLRKKFRVISARLAKGLDRSQLSLHDRALFDLSKQLWHPDYSATSPFSGVRNVGFDQGDNRNAGNGSSTGGDGQFYKSTLVGVKVNFSPTLPVAGVSNELIDGYHPNSGADCVGDGVQGEVSMGRFCNEDCENEADKLSEVNVEFEREESAMEDEGNVPFVEGIVSAKVGTGESIDLGCENKIGELTARVILNVFDECFKDVRRRLVAGGSSERAASAESFRVRWQQQRIAELDVLGSRLRLVLENSLQKS